MRARFFLCAAIAAAVVIGSPAASSAADETAAPSAARRVVLVGPSRELKTPSAAAAVAQDGDHVKIDPGEYKDCAIWTKDDLILEGAGGMAHVHDQVCADEAIWVITGSRITVRRIEFSGAHARPNNGAGLKFYGDTLLVDDGFFHNNENGILVGPNAKSLIRINKSRFVENGKCEPDCAHGIYIGKVAKLMVNGSTFERQHTAHHIKSRALITEVTGSKIEDGVEGTASFSIDLPNGGSAVIRNNFFQKGPKSGNKMAMISIGEEGHLNPMRAIYIGQNTFMSSLPGLESYIWNRTPSGNVVVERNSFIGDETLKLKGPGMLKP